MSTATLPFEATRRPLRQIELLAAAGLMYLLFLLYLTMGLDSEMMRGDVLNYWRRSWELSAPYDAWWPPGYPFLIALARTLMLNKLPPLAVMWLVSGVSYLVAIGTVYRTAVELRLRYAFQTALVFAVYPFVGLTESTYPIADITAIALFLLCVLSFERRRWVALVICAAMALMVHKATWFLIPPLMLTAFVRHRESRLLLPLAAVPLFVWIVCGAFYHRDAFWFARWGVEHLITSKSALPICDGILGPFLTGSISKMAKGVLVSATVLLAAVTFVYSYHLRFWSGLSISLSLILMAVVINQYEIWVVIRFSKVLVIPLAYILSQVDFRPAARMSPLFPALFLLCIASNVMFGHHMAALAAR
jgi:hypothetical protein